MTCRVLRHLREMLFASAVARQIGRPGTSADTGRCAPPRTVLVMPRAAWVGREMGVRRRCQILLVFAACRPAARKLIVFGATAAVVAGSHLVAENYLNSHYEVSLL